MMKSFMFALAGILQVWREERSFKVLSVCALVAVIVGYYLRFASFEWVILVGCITAVLSAEIVNTAIEDLCNKVEPRTDPLIGKIKDMMAGFVLVVSLGALTVGLLLLLEHCSFF